MPTAFFDPFSTEELKKNLPEIQKAMRLAKKLRGTQALFENMRDKEFSPGGLMESGRGSYYDVPDFYVPNYSGAADRIVGGLGGYLTDKQAEKAEGELDVLRDPYIVNAAQQIGYSDEDIAALMQQSLGLPGEGPPDPNDPRVAAAPPGVPQAPGAGGMTPPFSPMGPRPQMPGMGGEVPPQMPPVGGAASVAGSPAGGQPQGSNATFEGLNPQQTEELNRVVASMQAVGTSQSEIDAYVTRAMAKAALGPGQSMGAGSVQQYDLPTPETPDVPPGSAEGANPVAQALGQSLQIQGQEGPLRAPDGSPIANETALRAFLGMIGADDVIGKEGGGKRLFSTIEDEEGNIIQQYSDGTIKPTGIKARAKGVRFIYDQYEKKWYQFDPTYGHKEVPAAQVPNNVPQTNMDGTPMTVEQVRAATGAAPARGPGAQFSKAEEAAQVAPIDIATAGQKDVNKAALDRREAAKTALSKTDLTSDPGSVAAASLLKHPGLKKITAGTLGSYADAIGRKDDQGGYSFLGVGALARPFLAHTDPEAADALAMIDQIRGSAFATGFQALVGQGAGSISNQEGQGIARALANLETARSTPALEQALKDYINLTSVIKARWEREAAEGAAPAQAPAGARPAPQLPPGFSWEP